jgi:hypothetical protein
VPGLEIRILVSEMARGDHRYDAFRLSTSWIRIIPRTNAASAFNDVHPHIYSFMPLKITGNKAAIFHQELLSLICIILCHAVQGVRGIIVSNLLT